MRYEIEFDALNLATWELRVGKFRVYYDVFQESQSVVIILAVGIKAGAKVFIGDEEYPL